MQYFMHPKLGLHALVGLPDVGDGGRNARSCYLQSAYMVALTSCLKRRRVETDIRGESNSMYPRIQSSLLSSHAARFVFLFQLYSLVARGKTVLAEFTFTTGNFPTITRVLLGKIAPEDSKMSYVYDQ